MTAGLPAPFRSQPRHKQQRGGRPCIHLMQEHEQRESKPPIAAPPPLLCLSFSLSLQYAAPCLASRDPDPAAHHFLTCLRTRILLAGGPCAFWVPDSQKHGHDSAWGTVRPGQGGVLIFTFFLRDRSNELDGACGQRYIRALLRSKNGKRGGYGRIRILHSPH